MGDSLLSILKFIPVNFPQIFGPEAYVIIPKSVPRIGPNGKEKDNGHKDGALYGLDYHHPDQFSFPFFCFWAVSMDTDMVLMKSLDIT
jgi:hypothetical protein